MSQESLSARQRELVAASAAAARKHRAEADPTARRSAAVGDVFVVEAVSAFPVEWALLERPDGAGPFLAVPGDSHPHLGSRDLDVETSTGVLNLRCQAGVWLEPARLKPELRVGVLAPDDLERARQKVREIDAEGVAPDAFLEEIDTSPEYEQWMREVIDPARAAAVSLAVVQPLQRAVPVIPPAVSPRDRPSLWWLATAAAVLLLVSSGLTVRVLRQNRQIEVLGARASSSEAALGAERARREAERARGEAERGAAGRAREDVRELEEEVGGLRQRLALLADRSEPAAQPLLNAPVAILQPNEVLRGTEPRSYRLPATAPSLTLVLRFRETEPYPDYRLVLTREGDREPAWQTDGLKRASEGIQVTLPQRYLPSGRYRLSLSGLRSGEAQPVASYELMVTP